MQSIKLFNQILYINEPTGTSSGEIEQVKAKEKKKVGLDMEYLASTKTQSALRQPSLHMENCVCRKVYPFSIF